MTLDLAPRGFTSFQIPWLSARTVGPGRAGSSRGYSMCAGLLSTGAPARQDLAPGRTPVTRGELAKDSTKRAKRKVRQNPKLSLTSEAGGL